MSTHGIPVDAVWRKLWSGLGPAIMIYSTQRLSAAWYDCNYFPRGLFVVTWDKRNMVQLMVAFV